MYLVCGDKVLETDSQISRVGPAKRRPTDVKAAEGGPALAMLAGPTLRNNHRLLMACADIQGHGLAKFLWRRVRFRVADQRQKTTGREQRQQWHGQHNDRSNQAFTTIPREVVVDESPRWCPEMF